MKKLLIATVLWLSCITSFSFAENTYLNTLDAVATNRAWDKISWSDFKSLAFSIWNNILIPILIVMGLLLAFVGFYKLMVSDKEDERKKWLNFVIWWVIWIVLMVSAKFITNALFWEYWSSWILWLAWWQDYDPVTIANNLYDKVISKFLYMAMYLIVLILFLIIVISAIKYISNPDKEDVQKNAKTIMIWNTIWILVILFSKNIISLIYQKMQPWSYTLWQQSPILETKSIPWFYTILNYFLWFIAFAITVFIIYQAFLLLTKPEDDATYKSLKKYFVYSIIGVLIIWWVYIIANFLIVK